MVILHGYSNVMPECGRELGAGIVYDWRELGSVVCFRGVIRLPFGFPLVRRITDIRDVLREIDYTKGDRIDLVDSE